MDPIITNEFPKQPREKCWFPISFAERLAALNDEPRALDPIEFDPMPSTAGAVVLESIAFDPSTKMIRILVSGGLHNKKYPLTMWLHTVSGQRLEHQVTIKVKEKTK